MGLDIRLPIGLMFSLIGVLLTGYGAACRAGSSIKIDGQEININLFTLNTIFIMAKINSIFFSRRTAAMVCIVLLFQPFHCKNAR